LAQVPGTLAAWGRPHVECAEVAQTVVVPPSSLIHLALLCSRSHSSDAVAWRKGHLFGVLGCIVVRCLLWEGHSVCFDEPHGSWSSVQQAHKKPHICVAEGKDNMVFREARCRRGR